jgi:hypothetical protein
VTWPVILAGTSRAHKRRSRRSDFSTNPSTGRLCKRRRQVRLRPSTSVFAYDRQMTIDMNSLAREGAKARLLQLASETNELLRAFPDLRAVQHSQTPSRDRSRRGRRQMTAAERRSVSVRMKKYWAGRRKKNGASVSEATQPKRAVKLNGISAAGRAAIAAAQKKRWAAVRKEGQAKTKATGRRSVGNG